MSGLRKQSHSPHSFASFTSRPVSLGKKGMGRLFTASCSTCDWSMDGVDPDAVRYFARRHVEMWEEQWSGRDCRDMPDAQNNASNPRCLSSCEVQPHILKRCVRAVGHPERHLWVESLDLTDGKPIVAVWDDERNLALGYITLGDADA